jgi:carbon monoxide dehydrogenase subunit G
MEFHGRYSIPASPQAVWDALHNPSVLARSIPGCEDVEKISDTEFKTRAMVKIGPVKARFVGHVKIAPRVPDLGFTHALTLTGEGQGGAAGFARGESDVRLAPDPQGTILEYSAKAIVGGRIAQLGQRLIDGAAKSLADEFFSKFAAAMSAEQQTPSPAASAPASTPAAEEGLSPKVWVAGLIAIVGVLLILFSVVL